MDFFSRQRTVPDWHQSFIEAEKALVLGIGGIGCTVARELCRLGVSEVVMVDNDVVSASNLNRQVLYSGGDIGRRKVDAAVEGLDRDNLRTCVSGVHCDAVKEWSRIVGLAQNATVVFNCIDYGEYFDSIVMSLCVCLSLPYLTASSYGHTGIAECYPPVDPPGSGPCWVCNNAPSNKDIIQAITPDKVSHLDTINFLPQDVYMPSTQEVGSSVLSCSLAATLTVGAWLNSIHGYTTPHWISCDFATFQLFSYRSEPNTQCIICKNSPRYSPTLVNIYFGSEQIAMTPVDGVVLPYSKKAISNPSTQSHIDMARCRLESVCSMDDKRLYLPAPPAAQLDYQAPTDSTPLPLSLTSPMVKAKEGSQLVIRSGGRSAILSLYEGCFRLKGCGNYMDTEGMRYSHPGFPLAKLETNENGYEIRGCCFEHTALSEQYMSELVGQLLSEHSIPIGNKPMGLWQYKIPEDPTPMVTKYCGLFETLGERRVSSHLLPGLEALVCSLFPSVTEEEVWGLFPPDRRGEDGIKPTWSACCTGTNKSSPIDMTAVKLTECEPGSVPPEGIPPRFMAAWIQSAFRVRQGLSEGDTPTLTGLLSSVYRRVGWEMGVVKRVLEAGRVNWGYFFDHNPFEPHCNAHPNNFIVLPPGQSSLIAPVDFDLSFEERGFFSPYSDQGADLSLFDSWLSSEGDEMERAVAGEIAANTGLHMTPTRELSSTHSGLCWGFRDTLLLGYRAGYNREETVTLPQKARTLVDSIIKMALILTHSANA